MAKEIEAEVNLYLQHLFFIDTTTGSNNLFLDGAPPILDYAGEGFEKPGVTLLFGGNHGDKHCPISCKINLSSPAVWKHKEQLSYHCPLIVFASVQCTTDAYNLMDSTVMPKVKEQLLELKHSSVVTVYHQLNMTNAFRSYVVPSTIRPGTIGFIVQDAGMQIITMTFSHGKIGTFGSIEIDDPVFTGVPYYELGARVVISGFNELFIGDLAFLAMLIGMNHSSGSHCLMCMKKGSEFNCDHNINNLQTKEK